MMKYEPGNIVYLKNGGPPMFVITSDDISAEVVWLDKTDRIQKHTFMQVMLKGSKYNVS